MSGRAIVNVESLIAVLFVVTLLIRAKPAPPPVAEERRPETFAFIGVVICLVLLLYQGDLHNGFLIDDYTHLHDGGIANFRTLLTHFGRVPGQQLFYRPVPEIGYWIDLHWAHLDPFRWHLWSLLAHAADSFLVFRLLCLLNLKRPAAVTGGLFFALFAGSAEAVSWVDARTDLICAFFVIGSLILMLEYSSKPHWARLTLAMAFCAIACCAKESAFAIPFLAAALAIALEGQRRRHMLRAAFSSAFLCAVVFVYRWWALAGIGGYPSHFNPLRALNGLLFRAWGFLLFPINWSAPLTTWQMVPLVAYVVVLLLAAITVRAHRGFLLCGVAFILAGLLPVYNMTLMSSDLAGSREFYVPTVGFTILAASIFSIPRMMVALLFQATMLHHNLQFWSDTSRVASQVCRETASIALKNRARTAVTGLPIKRDGVPFLANGFPECVAFFAPGAEVEVVGTEDPRAGVLVWDPQQNRLRPRR